MTVKKYRQIFKEVVKPWIEAGDDFVLEEDRDTAHGTKGENGSVKKLKEKHRLSITSMHQRRRVWVLLRTVFGP